MRSLQVVMFMLCLLGGSYLLTQGPDFFMPDRWNPASGWQFGATASRLLGGGLLATAAAGANYLQNFYYSDRRRLPGPAAQRRHFMLLALALALIAAALVTAVPTPNPDYRPPTAQRQ